MERKPNHVDTYRAVRELERMFPVIDLYCDDYARLSPEKRTKKPRHASQQPP